MNYRLCYCNLAYKIVGLAYNFQHAIQTKSLVVVKQIYRLQAFTEFSPKTYNLIIVRSKTQKLMPVLYVHHSGSVSTCLCISLYLCVCVSLCISLYLPVRLSVLPRANLCVYAYVAMYVFVFIRTTLCAFLCLFTRLCLSLRAICTPWTNVC